MLNLEGQESVEARLERARSDLQANDASESVIEEEVSIRVAELTQADFELRAALAATFGTPDDPFAPEETGLKLNLLRKAAGPTGGKDVEAQFDTNGNLVENGYRLGGLFREHCVHCHGVSGDGAGPTARFLDPYPRDFRRGIFKFTSTGSKQKPTEDDLRRTIEQGLHGTGMQAFGIALKPDEITALVEYVKYLALRGEYELALRADLFDEVMTVFVDDNSIDMLVVTNRIKGIVNNWDNATVTQPVPRPIPWEQMTEADKQASIERGRQLFENEGQCVKCHGPAGLGDGGQLNYDDWNTAKALVEDEHERAEMWLLPLQELKARNLQLGVFRGGRRPIDIYRRIRNGITGTPMPAASILKEDDSFGNVESAAAQTGDAARNDADAGDATGADGSNAQTGDANSNAESGNAGSATAGQDAAAQTDPEAITPQPIREEEIWHIVDYVLSLQYERGFRTPTPEIATPTGR
ncbi:MAG: cytochrome c [Pirellulales bacterium]|nr:cytochrome c [Pirellulales bacterium]